MMLKGTIGPALGGRASRSLGVQGQPEVHSDAKARQAYTEGTCLKKQNKTGRKEGKAARP